MVAEPAGVLALPVGDGEAVGPLPGLAAVTGGAVALDRGRAAVRTPLAAFEWRLREGVPLSAALLERPRAMPLPPTPRGEAISYRPDGSGLVLTSEGAPFPLYEVGLGLAERAVGGGSGDAGGDKGLVGRGGEPWADPGRAGDTGFG